MNTVRNKTPILPAFYVGAERVHSPWEKKTNWGVHETKSWEQNLDINKKKRRM